LLVVIAIMGILIGLMLPAVQAARESARRSKCLNNLAQLIIAVHSYESAHEVYPAGVINDKGPIRNEAKGYHHNWIIQILPYFEQGNTYRHIDNTVGVYAPQNAPVRAMEIATLICPSEPSMPWSGGGSNYAGCHHDVEAPIDVDNNGVFFLNSHLNYEDIRDGAAHTIFLGEKRLESADLGWMSGTRATLRNTGTPINSTPLPGTIMPPGLPVDAAAPTTEGQQAEPPAADGPAADAHDQAAPGGATPETDADKPTHGAAAAAPDDDKVVPEPNKAQAPAVPRVAKNHAAAAAAGSILYVGGFGSPHATLANFAFGDGSARALTATMDPRVLQQLGHRADGKLLDAIDR